VAKPILRTFAYIDEHIIDDFLAQIEGGLLDGSYTRKTTSSKGKGGGLRARAHFIEADASGNSASSTEEEAKYRETPPVKFTRLYELLKDNDLIQSLNGFDQAIYEQISAGEIIESRGVATLPQWEHIKQAVDEFGNLAQLMPYFGQSVDQATIDQLDGFSRLAAMKDTGDSYIILSPGGSPNFKIVAKVGVQQIQRTKQDLEGEVALLGKVQRRLDKRETIEVFQLIRNTAVLENLNRAQRRSMARQGGRSSISESPIDEVIKYPALEIVPIAIYR
jgi:hypothetical protein